MPGSCVRYQAGSGATSGRSPTRVQVSRSLDSARPICWSRTRVPAAGVQRRVVHPPGAVLAACDRARPQRHVVPASVVAGCERIRVHRPVRQVRGARVADERRLVAQRGVLQGRRGLEEEEVVALAVVGDPTVPDPVLGVLQHRRNAATLGRRWIRGRCSWCRERSGRCGVATTRTRWTATSSWCRSGSTAAWRARSAPRRPGSRRRPAAPSSRPRRRWRARA